MIITSFFSDKGSPRSGLSPIINIVDVNSDTLVVDSGIMVALATMTYCYYYDFVAYDESKDYAVSVDGGAVLNDVDRYQFGINEKDMIHADVTLLKKIAIGRWKIDGTQMIMYDDDAITPLYTFNLKDVGGNATQRNVFERVRV